MESTKQQDPDFARLYRAALAETDPRKKSSLLREVQQILLEWHDKLRTEPQKPDGTDDSLNDPAA
jgi:hypothetical protein